MSDLDRILNELGVITRPVPAPERQPRRDDPSKDRGIWYTEETVPH